MLRHSSQPSPRRRLTPFGLVVALLWLGGAVQTAAGEASGRELGFDALRDLSFDELLEVRITSATRTEERLGDASATVIVITRREILDRGYTELSEILDDLPGMQVIRPFGPTYFKNYWRGYRNTIGDPFLLLVDGLEYNHLYFNTADVMAVIPMSNIERVEVVFGPASSIYGANAFMGVINVISRQERSEDGSYFSGWLTAGSSELRLADLTAGYQSGELAITFSARLEDGQLDDGANNRYEYSRDAYFGDRRLWGGFVDNPEIAGDFSSPRQHRAADLRIRLGEVELGMSSYRLDSGYGLEYPGDRAQANGVWARPDSSVHLRVAHAFNDAFAARTLLRYRESDVDSDSFWLEAADEEDEIGVAQRVVAYTYWQSASSSWSLHQDFDYRPRDDLSLSAGFMLERKDLQKAYVTSSGPFLPPSEVDAATYPYPLPPANTAQAANRITTEDVGVYLHGRYRVNDRHALHLGLRHDDNSHYGGATTVRGGWVGQRDRWTFKALYGEGFHEPTPRLLFGGWIGSGSDPDLAPETSRTIELSVGLNQTRRSAFVSVYWVENEDTIVNTTSGGRNLGERSVLGADLHGNLMVHAEESWRLKLWGYYSHLFHADERVVSLEGVAGGAAAIGDLAADQLSVGATAELARHVVATVRGRWVAARDTVSTNPVGRVPSYSTVDLNLAWRQILGAGFGVSLKVTNLLDEEYFHPGVREADAGVEPGFFDDDGSWHGSAGWYSSLLPQPGRAASVSLHLEF